MNARILDVHRLARKGDKVLCMTKLDALSRIHVKMPPTKTPPLFFQNKNYFTKTPPLLYWQNGTLNIFFLLKRWYHVWYLLIQDLSSKFIYCIYMFILHQTTTNLYIYILYTPVIVSYPFVFFFSFFFCDNKINSFSQNRDNCCRPTSLLHWLLFLYSAWNNNFLTDTNFLETRNDYVNRN